MTRRSFCFLFGAGIVGYALPPQEDSFEIIAEIQPFDFNRILLDEFVTPQYLQPFKITGLRDLGPFKITGTFIRATDSQAGLGFSKPEPTRRTYRLPTSAGDFTRILIGSSGSSPTDVTM